MTTPRPPRRGTRHRKRLRGSRRAWAALAIAAAIGLALIITLTVPTLLRAAGQPRSGKPAPTVPASRVTVTVMAPRPTVTVLRPGPTVTVTELRPGPTVTIVCRHPGHCNGSQQ